MISTVEQYIIEHNNFSEEILFLRKIILSTNLEETIKWGMPTYVHKGKNVVGIGAFKAHYGLWFFKGSLVDDGQKVLLNAQEGKTSVMRQWRFEIDTILDQKLILNYIEKAIEVEKRGVKIETKKKPLIIPPELKTIFVENRILGEMFDILPEGKKREFADYISNAKRRETKIKRIEKILPMILNNVGLNDKYKNC